MPKITPFLTFDDQAEEAMTLYTSTFADSRVLDVSRYGPGGPIPEGVLMSATIELAGQQFMVLNGGPHFSFSDGVSLFVTCQDQDEVDDLCSRLTRDGGELGPCGWLTDRFGVSWQIIPTALGEMLGDADQDKAHRVLQAMLQMHKIDIQGLRNAYDGK